MSENIKFNSLTKWAFRRSQTVNKLKFITNNLLICTNLCSKIMNHILRAPKIMQYTWV